MPIVEISALERRFDDEESVQKLIERLTDAVCDIFGEAVRAETWVIVNGVSPAHWGFGGERRL